MSDKERKEFIDSLLINVWNTLPSCTASPYSHSYDLTPSLIRAETDEQGNIYGYKVLIWDMQEERFQSPLYPARWEREGFLESDKEPTENSKHGIYFMKSVDDPELDDYFRNIEQKIRFTMSRDNAFIVRCILSGVIVEAERGFRSQYAKIEGVVHNGNWKTYQDFQNEAQYHNRTRYHEPAYFPRYEAYTPGTTYSSTKLAGTDENPTKS